MQLVLRACGCRTTAVRYYLTKASNPKCMRSSAGTVEMLNPLLAQTPTPLQVLQASIVK
jgi:hypothetical protein